jgi:hypothetical protein
MANRPSGVRRGERVSDYHQMTVRIPPETVLLLKAAAETLNRPQWRVVVDAVHHYLEGTLGLSAQERQAVRRESASKLRGAKK